MHQTWRPCLVVLFLSNVVVGDSQEAHQHCSNVGRPRTVLTENICRCVQQIIEHSPAIMPFLTTSTITLSCLASAAPQADSWWFGHVVPDDVVIVDIAGQALDIFLHVPESAHKNGILKTFTYTSIPIQPCSEQTKSKTLSSPNMKPTFTCPLPDQCRGGQRPGSLADAPQTYFSMVQSLRRRIASWRQTFTHTSVPIHPYTLLKQRAKPSTHQTWRLCCLPVQCGGGRWPGSLAPAPEGCSTLEALSPPLWRPCRLGQCWQKTSVDVFNKYSNIAWQQCPF